MKTLKITDTSAYTLLKTEIQETFGKKIHSSGDCVLLCEEVYAKVSFKINSNTLRRFFGLVNSRYLPSATTLDILSKYCGFSSFGEFLTLKNAPHEAGEGAYYSNSILNHLVMLFRDTPVKGYDDKTFFWIVKHIILFLQRHPELIDKFQRAISKTKNGQDFYFEQFIQLDKLNTTYGDGLRYYLLEKTTPEAQIFGHSILCLRYWFSENAAAVKEHHDEVVKNKLEKGSHPFLCGRFFATRLLYADSYALPIGKILVEAQQTHASFKHKAAKFGVFPYFEYMIAPVLFMTGHAEESLYYINYSLNSYPEQHSDVAVSFYQTMNLTKALTLAKTGKKKSAQKLFRHIQPSKFGDLLKKTNTIQYLLLSQYLGKSNPKSDQQLKDLINETGFTKLNQILKTE